MAVRKWAVVAAFFTSDKSAWLDDFISDEGLEFTKVPAVQSSSSWHSGTQKRTAWKTWLGHLKQARQAMAQKPDGIICSFPPLTMCAALLRKVSFRKPVIIGYTYNLGGFPGGLRRWLARWVAREVDRFVVHSPTEVEPYAAYLGVDVSRVMFLPLQRGRLSIERVEQEPPYIIAMGSAGRDYPTLIHAVNALRLPTKIITRKADIAAFPQSDVVSYYSDLSSQACLEMMAGARMIVTPVANMTTASGQITFINALQIGVPNIVTQCPGVEGYITSEQNGLLVPHGSVSAMQAAIERLWGDDDLRARLSAQGIHDAHTIFSDEAAAEKLRALIYTLDPMLETQVER